MGEFISTSLSKLTGIFSEPSINRESKKKMKPNKPRHRYIELEDILINGPSDTDLYIKVEFEGDLKRTVSAFDFAKEIGKFANINTNKIFSASKTSFVCLVEAPSDSIKLQLFNVKSIEGNSCYVSSCDQFNHSKGIIYLRGLSFDDEITLNEFSEWLTEKYSLFVKIEPAPFIRPNNPQTKAFILTFNRKDLPQSIYIPGLTGDTKIYPFHNKPMMCRKCQKYGHTEKSVERNNL